ncbi:MAG: hypothetical protein JO152_07100 [Mycobacteriaceae bacterium]|nr:hypothetical protein [Mycobacteriaceae bacterium]
MPQTTIIPSEGKTRLATMMFGPGALVDDPMSLRLYKNNYVVGESTTWSDLVEADYAGYARVPLTRSGWVQAFDPMLNLVIGWPVPLDFTATAGEQVVYGCVAACDDDDTILGACTFALAITIQSGVSFARVLPTFQIADFA